MKRRSTTVMLGNTNLPPDGVPMPIDLAQVRLSIGPDELEGAALRAVELVAGGLTIGGSSSIDSLRDILRLPDHTCGMAPTDKCGLPKTINPTIPS